MCIHEKYDEAKEASKLADLTKQEIQTRKRNSAITTRSVASYTETKEQIQRNYEEKANELNQRLDQQKQKLQEQHKKDNEIFENMKKILESTLQI